MSNPPSAPACGLGWQWDATGDDALRLYAPIAKEKGQTIHGLLRGDLMPSKVKEEIPLAVLVPQVDREGNEIAGVHLPEISLPLATYTGWNLRDPSIGAPTQRVSFEVPTCRSRGPRPSVSRRAIRGHRLQNATPAARTISAGTGRPSTYW
jgi:hypothetical protein